MAKPNRIRVPGQESCEGRVLHSIDYRDGQTFKGRRVLVYGAEILPVTSPWIFAMDLMHHWQPCFRTVSAILIVLSTVVAKDAISSFHVQPDPSTDSLSSISLLGWLNMCPEDLAKHAGAFLLMAAR